MERVLDLLTMVHLGIMRLASCLLIYMESPPGTIRSLQSDKAERSLGLPTTLHLLELYPPIMIMIAGGSLSGTILLWELIIPEELADQLMMDPQHNF